MTPQTRDDEQAVDANPDAMHFDAPAEPGGQINLLRFVAEQVIRDRHRHQHKSDGEQHLIERACAIEPPIERALERDAEDCRNEEGRRQGREERNAGAVHHQRRHVAADHREGAVGEVDEIHQPERHRQSCCKHKQQHAVRHAVEQDRQHRGSPPSPSGLRYSHIFPRRSASEPPPPCCAWSPSPALLRRGGNPRRRCILARVAKRKGGGGPSEGRWRGRAPKRQPVP